MPVVVSQVFLAPRSPAEAPLAAQLSQFFRDNPTVTVIDAATSWREGARRGRRLVVTLSIFTGNLVKTTFPAGAPYDAVEFIGTAAASAVDQAQAFLAAHPSVIPVRTLDTQSREGRYTQFGRLLLIYVGIDYLTLIHSTLSASGFTVSDIPPNAVGEVADATDDTRSRMANTANLSVQAWKREGQAMVAKATFFTGENAYAAVGPAWFAPGPPTILPPPPPIPSALALCADCCYALVEVSITRGEAVCTHDYSNLFANSACYSGSAIDIMKASVQGYISTPGACGCNPVNAKWAWPDPDHYYFAAQTTYEGGFWGVIGFEDRAPACADFDYNDAIIIVRYRRSTGGTPAPVNPATPGVPG